MRSLLLAFILSVSGLSLSSCSQRRLDSGSGFVADGQFTRFLHRGTHDPEYVIFTHAPPPAHGGTSGSDIYGNGYHDLQNGRIVHFKLTDEESVIIDGKSVRLRDGRFISVLVASDGTSQVEQFPLDTPLAQTILKF